MPQSSTAQSLDASERRVFPRKEFEVGVDLFNDNTFFTGFTENISEGGLFIATGAPLNIGDELEIRLSMMGKPPRTHAVVVRWIRPSGGLGGLPAGMGVQFLDLSEEERAALQDFVDSGLKDTLFVDLD
jgi:uncharacterized protein (TIGR02266 family)